MRTQASIALLVFLCNHYSISQSMAGLYSPDRVFAEAPQMDQLEDYKVQPATVAYILSVDQHRNTFVIPNTTITLKDLQECNNFTMADCSKEKLFTRLSLCRSLETDKPFSGFNLRENLRLYCRATLELAVDECVMLTYDVVVTDINDLEFMRHLEKAAIETEDARKEGQTLDGQLLERPSILETFIADNCASL